MLFYLLFLYENKGIGQLSRGELVIILGLWNGVSEPMLNPTETSIPQGYAVIINQ
jgi:hypothetical protein